ncbi:hypothetical protein GCM10017673_11110 [Streptosporangium violaceochromogenes]|nr:hypothetical protein GCM10017673_11110 [Streptosporangium violaceochromogenes]
MRAHVILCDSAQLDQSTGKMHMLGADWTVTGPQVPPFSVVVFLRVPWEEAQKDHTFEIRLLDDSGQPVVPAEVPDGKPVSFTSRLKLNPDSPLLEESVKMIDIHSAIAVNAPALRIPTGQRYRWVVEVDGKEIGSTMFIVRSTPLRDDEANNAS